MATSALQKKVGFLLDRIFPQYSVKENTRPDWLLSSDLTRLELDFFIEDLLVAFEIQGQQHYNYVPYFHGDYSGFEAQKRRDEEKVDLCRGAGVRLIVVDNYQDALLAALELPEAITPQEKRLQIVQHNYNAITGLFRLMRYGRKNGTKSWFSHEKDEELKRLHKYTLGYIKRGDYRRPKTFKFILQHLTIGEVETVMDLSPMPTNFTTL